MSELSGSATAELWTSNYPKLKDQRRKEEKEGLAMSEGGSAVEIKRAGGLWVSI